MRITFIFILGLVLIVEACGKKDKKPKPEENNLTKVSLRQEWFPNSNYSGALFAKNEFAKGNRLDIIIDAGSDQIDPVRMVITGQNTFGDASADKVLLANEKGADLVVIGVVSYNSPTCFLAKEEKGIITPKDFEGKKVGVLSGTNTEYVYRTLLKKASVDVKKIKEIEAPFDLTSFITLDAYDVRPAYIYDETVALDLNKVSYTLIEPKNYGVRFIGTVYFTTRKYIIDHPEIVQGFVNAIADGWKAAIKYPERAIEFLKKSDETIDSNRELLSFKKGMDYYKGKDGKILWADMTDWEEMVKSLKELGVLKNVDLSRCINNEFLKTYYNSQK